MTRTTTTPFRTVPAPNQYKPAGWQAAPADTQERLRRIELMAQWISGYAEFMCQGATQNAASPSVTDKAVAAFYEEMLTLERSLARIQEAFRLE